MTLKIHNEIRKLQENPLLGEWRVHTALLRMGIEVSPITCGRIMAANRQLYGLEKPQRQPRAKLEMPFQASHKHEYWSADIRYIEEHLLPDPHPVYVITIFENFSRIVLSSAISTSQTQWDYLAVLTDAIRRYGAPEALVTDGVASGPAAARPGCTEEARENCSSCATTPVADNGSHRIIPPLTPRHMMLERW